MLAFDRFEPTLDLGQAGMDRPQLLVDDLFDDRTHDARAALEWAIRELRKKELRK
jgi:hypothetical protein